MRSPTWTGCAGFAREPLTCTRPPRQAAVAADRVLYRRTAHTQASARAVSATSGLERRGEGVHRVVDLLAGDHQRRSDAQGALVRLLAEHPLVAQCHRDLAAGLVGGVDVDAGPQPAAP